MRITKKCHVIGNTSLRQMFLHQRKERKQGRDSRFIHFQELFFLDRSRQLMLCSHPMLTNNSSRKSTSSARTTLRSSLLTQRVRELTSKLISCPTLSRWAQCFHTAQPPLLASRCAIPWTSPSKSTHSILTGSTWMKRRS